VGAIGYTLGGGLGWLGRKYGLSADNVLAFELVTPDGVLRRAAADENADLFWGLRGGGGSLGIVTGMTIRLFPVAEVYAGNLYYPAAMARDVFRHYRAWIADAPDELTSSVLVMNFPPLPVLPEFLRGQTFVIVRGCYCGPMAEGEALLRHWRDWRTPQLDHFGPMPFSAAATISNDPVDPLPGFNTGAWLSALSDDAIDAIVDHAVITDGSVPLIFAEVRHAGGAIRRVPAQAAAFGNRDAELVLSVVGVTPFPGAQELLEAHGQSLKDALQPVLTGGVYMNFLEGEESRRRIRDGLAQGAYDRLAKLKAQVDPENVLRYGFNVVPASS
jgi:FAD/FMN-containing dehydrogenase